MEAVKVSGVRKTFADGAKTEEVLRDVTFSLETGTFTALTGISGAGKTTLLHLLAGFQKPDEGEIFLCGRRMQGLGEREAALFRRRHVAMVFQEASLLPGLTVEENLVLPVILDTGRSLDEKRLDRILCALSLTGQRSRYPVELSGGQKQRAVLGRALFSEAELILADEPAARLDTRQSLELMGLLKQCASAWHRTILMATHDLDLAQICDRVLELKDGRIQAG